VRHSHDPLRPSPALRVVQRADPTACCRVVVQFAEREAAWDDTCKQVVAAAFRRRTA